MDKLLEEIARCLKVIIICITTLSIIALFGYFGSKRMNCYDNTVPVIIETADSVTRTCGVRRT
jgi:hypothetical protein